MSDVLLIEYVADLLKDDARFYLGLLGDLEKEIEESKTRYVFFYGQLRERNKTKNKTPTKQQNNKTTKQYNNETR